MTTIAERVAKGAALLDEREPGWWQRINLDALDLQAPCRCILGQLDHDTADKSLRWDHVVENFGLKYDSADDVRHGFNAEDPQTPRQYAHLTAAWRELIEARRAAS